MMLKELQEKRAELANEIRKLADTQAGWKDDDRAKWSELNQAYDANKLALDAENKRLVEAAAVQERTAQIEQDSEPIRSAGRDNATLRDDPMDQSDSRKTALRNQMLALQGWLMSGNQDTRSKIGRDHVAAMKAVRCGPDDREFVLNLGSTIDVRKARLEHTRSRFQNAMSVGVPSTGGFTVGETLVSTLERAMQDFSGVLQVADIIRTSTGELLYWPTADDTGNTGSRVGEGADAGTATDPTFGRVSWNAYTFTSGQLQVSRDLLTDSIFNLEEIIGQMMGERLGRKQNTDYTTGGGGGNSPRGIVNASALGVTAASATAIAYDEVIDLEHSIDPSRRNLPGVGYMMRARCFGIGLSRCSRIWG